MTNAYEEGRRLAKECLPCIKSYIIYCEPSAYVIDIPEETRIPAMKCFQKWCGDLIVIGPGYDLMVECKAEREYTGNLFIETWSNKTCDSAMETPGWIFNLRRCDLLFYYFRDSRYMVSVPVGDIREMLGIEAARNERQCEPNCNLFRYREIEQQKAEQRNRTFGRIVPIRDVLQFSDKARQVWFGADGSVERRLTSSELAIAPSRGEMAADFLERLNALRIFNSVA